MHRTTNRIGIYAGSFDPIHVGHITFALQALKEGKLDVVYFTPERLPKNKLVQEHFGHRVAMIKQAIKPHKRLKLLELTERQFTVNKTLTTLENQYNGKQLVFLFGSDKIGQIKSWPNSKKLFSSCQFIIGLRDNDDLKQVEFRTKDWPVKSLQIINSFAPNIASTKIRQALNQSQIADGLLKSVSKYIRQNWLYISLNKL